MEETIPYSLNVETEEEIAVYDALGRGIETLGDGVYPAGSHRSCLERSLPYAILFDPGGEVIYSHQGEVNQYILKKIIVDHPLLGRAR